MTCSRSSEAEADGICGFAEGFAIAASFADGIDVDRDLACNMDCACVLLLLLVAFLPILAAEATLLLGADEVDATGIGATAFAGAARRLGTPAARLTLESCLNMFETKYW